MNRRSLVMSGVSGLGGLAAASVVTGRAMAGEAGRRTPREEVAAAAAECVRTGYACVEHCMKQLAAGKTEFDHCNRSVHEMLAFCEAALKLASYDSSRLAAFAAVCAESCRECKEACNEHSAHWAHGMHLECKACFDACVRCEAACRAIA